MSLIDCSRVNVVPCEHGLQAVAATFLRAGDLVERGVMRRLPGYDGNRSEHVFTWSDDVPNHVWAFASGCATFYNTDLPERANTAVTRFFDEDRFEIHATRDIPMGEALTHTYKSLRWRGCWDGLRAELGVA